MAPVQREVRLVDPAAPELGRHQGDGLGPAIGQEEPVRVDTHGLGQRTGGGRDVVRRRIAPERMEIGRGQ
jgi:hypothetical protein